MNSIFAQDDPLPSWNATAPKKAVMDFVQRVSLESSPDFVSIPERIAVFDNDGTLWSEAPIPMQAAFVFDELKRRVPMEPDLANDPMVKAALAGDLNTLMAGKHHDGLMHILALTHAGMTADVFDANVDNWALNYKHPKYGRTLQGMTYQPMQELLNYLRANDFKVFIVSGGGADFMRALTEDIYGIPPEQVVGSTGGLKFEMRHDKPVLIKNMETIFVDDREGKPVGIHQFIGRRPIACFGNSDGDEAMLQYTTIDSKVLSFGMIIHHTDAEREYAYDEKPPASGKLVQALADSTRQGWTIVSMKDDWNTIFAPEKKAE
jgi:phosphoglycolate phosphatase-like HAD superfamily hydrolase